MKPASGKKLTLSLNSLQESSSEPVYRRGVQYYRRKKVLKYEESEGGAKIEALVIGSEPQPYKVNVTVESEAVFKAECSCPYFEEVCKHSVAVILTHIARGNPGIRFDLAENDRGRDNPQDRAPKAKEMLDDAKGNEPEPEESRHQLGVLVLEKPLSLDRRHCAPRTPGQGQHSQSATGISQCSGAGIEKSIGSPNTSLNCLRRPKALPAVTAYHAAMKAPSSVT